MIDPPRRIIDRVYSFTELFRFTVNSPTDKLAHTEDDNYFIILWSELVSKSQLVRLLLQIKTLKEFQVARGCQTDACKFYSGRETIDMKEAVVNHS